MSDVVKFARKPRVFQGPKMKYFMHGSERVMIDKQAQNDWNDIDSLEISKVHYEKSRLLTDGPGEMTGPAFDRWEITNYDLRSELISEAKFNGELNYYTKEYKPSSEIASVKEAQF